MMNFQSFLKRNIGKYPNSTIQDYLKLIYQSVFGTGHLVSDQSNSLKYLQQELIESNNTNELLYEYISHNYVRVNLSPYKKSSFPIEKLNDYFVRTSQITSLSNTFIEKINYLESLTNKSSIIDDYKNNPKPVHHSDSYRKFYNPHYRVIHKSFINIDYKVSLLETYLHNKLNTLNKNELYFIALEGKCCSGKSTITKNINTATIIHADDFFSKGDDPLDFKAIRETLLNLKLQQTNIIKIYNCMTDTFITKEINDLKNIVIVEGVYSYHQKIRDLFNEVIYVNEADDQLERLQIRCAGNNNLFNKFINIWLPREEKYFQSFDFIYNSSLII